MHPMRHYTAPGGGRLCICVAAHYALHTTLHPSTGEAEQMTSNEVKVLLRIASELLETLHLRTRGASPSSEFSVALYVLAASASKAATTKLL